MKRFKNVLCYYHKKYDQVALDAAFALAKRNQAKLTIMDIVEKDMASGIKEHLDLLVNPYQGKGVDIKTKVVKGIPIIKLVRAVKENNYDLLISSTLGSPIKGYFWDGIALKLIRKIPVPVWIIKSKGKYPPQKIVAAVDLSSDKSTRELNKKILEMASSLANQSKGNLTIVHGWLPESEPGMVTGYTILSKDKKDSIKEKVKSAKLKELKKLADQYKHKKLKISIRLVEKTPSMAIAEVVSKTKADITVIGTVYKTGIVGFIMGNTAEETLPLLTSSLLAVKPEGFKSPIS